MKLGNKSGITLPETMIACLILGLTISGVLSGFVMCRKAISFAGNSLVAMHDARRLLESLTTEKYTSSSLSLGTHNMTNGFYLVTESSGVKKIDLTVRWMDPTRASTSSITLTTSMANAVHQ